MLYGDEKINQMARSVLPATRRRGRTARQQKQQWNQSTRARMNQDLRRSTHRGMAAEAVIEAWDDNPSAWLDTYSPGERRLQKDIVRERRLADNLGPIRSWTRSMAPRFEDPADLIEDLSKKLPQTLAGRHALQHMNSEFGPDGYDFRGYKAANRRVAAARYAEKLEQLKLIVTYSLGNLNREIRKGNNYWRIRCAHRVRTFQKPPVPGWRGRMMLGYSSPCDGIVEITPTNMYDEWVICPRCSGKIAVRNIRPISCPADIPRFIKENRRRDGLDEWIKAEYERQRQFINEPARSERHRALVSVLASYTSGMVMASRSNPD